MGILFTEYLIASVLLADWSKSLDWGCCTPTGFFTHVHIWSNFYSFSNLLQPDFLNLYSTWSNFSIFAVVTPI